MRRSALLLATISLGACAPVGPSGADQTRMAGADILGPPAPRQCFFPSQIINYRQGETQQIFVRVLGGDVYQLSAGGCLDLDYTNAIAVMSDIGASDRLCTGDYARLTVRGTSSPTFPCRARVDRRLTEAEVAALPSRQRP